MRWRELVIRKLGGFNTVNEAIDSIETVTEKHELLTRAVKRHFNTIGPDEILHEADSGEWMFKGKPLNKGQQQLLVSESKVFLSLMLWEVLQADVKYQANRQMYRLARTETDIIMGKCWEYVLDVIRTRLKSIEKGKANFNSKNAG